MKARIKGSIGISSILLVVLSSVAIGQPTPPSGSDSLLGKYDCEKSMPDGLKGYVEESYTLKHISNDAGTVKITYCKRLSQKRKDNRKYLVNLFVRESSPSECPEAYVVRTQEMKESAGYNQEKLIYKALKEHPHKNIVKSFDILEEPSTGIKSKTTHAVHTTAEEYGGEDLWYWAPRLKKQTEAEKADIVVQIAKGIKHLHVHHIYHRDIKRENIVFDGKTIKLIDFDLSQIMDSYTMPGDIKVFIGTVDYLDPALAKEMDQKTLWRHKRGDIEKRLSAADIWALAVVTIYIYTQEGLFDIPGNISFQDQPRYAKSHIEPFEELDARQLNLLNGIPEGRPREVVKQTLQLKLESRPSIDDFISAFKGAVSQ